MTIRKKDGTVYVIEGPNKLLKDQKDIDLSNCIFHNFEWQEIIYKKTGSSKISIPKPKPEPEPQETIAKPEPELQETIAKPKIEEDFKFPILKVKVLMHCLPAKVSSFKDSFYGDGWERINYGEKFIFPSVMISNNDLEMSFWTSDPNDKIKEKSIIFPFSYEIYNENIQGYDKVPFDEHRWWKVDKKEAKEGGWLIHTIPSQDHPDFSD